MPTKREDYNGYMRKFMLAKYHRRRREAIRKLGGRCALCGSKRKLEFDHRDPSKKSFSLWSGTVSEERFQMELKKCQLLCQVCHRDKTLRDLGRKLAKGTHGSLSAYPYCGPPKCSACRKAKSDYMREYYRKNPRYKKNSRSKL